MCFEEQGQNNQKTHFLTGKGCSTKVCTCRTLANECQCNTMSIDIQGSGNHGDNMLISNDCCNNNLKELLVLHAILNITKQNTHVLMME
jgi:hypothetical protein